MSDFYDPDGNPLTLMDWAVKFEDETLRHMAVDHLPNGFVVSTIWLGLDQRPLGGALGGLPLIFETMVFSDAGRMDQARYATKAEALAGHAAMVETWGKKRKRGRPGKRRS